MGDLLVTFPHGIWSIDDLEREGSSGTGQNTSQQTGEPLFVPPASTPHGVPIEQAVSALRNCVRTADLKFALYWTAQLDLAGLSRTSWYVLVMMMFSDVGLVYPSAPLMAFELYQLWINSLTDVQQQRKDGVTTGPFEGFQSSQCPESRRILLTMASMACSLPKSRLVAHADSAQLLHNDGQLAQTDWGVKIGSNRKLSAVIRPLRDTHTLAVSKAITCLTQYIVNQYEPGMLRVSDLLMEWGHTSVLWDVIRNVCSHYENLRWAKYYHHRYERMWHWATGNATSGKDASILFETHIQDALSNDWQEYAEIPSAWKTRHGQTPAYISSRTIPIQCLLLIVRSNPGILEGITPGQCTQYDSTVDSYYSPTGRMNKLFEVPEKAKTMFTVEGLAHGRGFDFYWQESECLSQSVETVDPYEQMIFNGYMAEENEHGIGACANDSIIARRISAPGYYEKGYDSINPIAAAKKKRMDQIALQKSQDLVAMQSYQESRREDESSHESNQDSFVIAPHIDRQKKRFRNPRPGPPKNMDITSILGSLFEKKVSIPDKEMEECLPEQPTEVVHEPLEPPPFLLCDKENYPNHVRTKVYKQHKESITLSKVSTWDGNLYKKEKEKKRNRKRKKKKRSEGNTSSPPPGSQPIHAIVCGPVSRGEASKGVVCNTLEQAFAADVFARQHVSIKQLPGKGDVCYLLAQTKAPRQDEKDLEIKRYIFRWCEGCLVMGDMTSTNSIDAWIGLDETKSWEEIDADQIPKVTNARILEWCSLCFDAISASEAVERQRKQDSVASILLGTLRTRFDYLIQHYSAA